MRKKEEKSKKKGRELSRGRRRPNDDRKKEEREKEIAACFFLLLHHRLFALSSPANSTALQAPSSFKRRISRGSASPVGVLFRGGSSERSKGGRKGRKRRRRKKRGHLREREKKKQRLSFFLSLNIISLQNLPLDAFFSQFQRVITTQQVQCGIATSVERPFETLLDSPHTRQRRKKKKRKNFQTSAPRESASQARPAASRNRARSCCRPAP